MLKLRKEDWFHQDGFPIVVERRDPQQPFGLHCHEFSEVVIITGGNGVHTTGEETYQLSAGDTFVIGGDRPHDYLNMDRLSLINILFDPNELPMSLADLNALPGYHTLFNLEPAWRRRHEFSSKLKLSPGELVQATRLVDQLEQELDQRLPGFGAMAISTWLQLAVFLSRCYAESKNEESQGLLRIADAVSHIEQNFSNPITLAELVDISGMSRRSFLRAFESAFKCPPITYLIRLRIRHACRLLLTSDSSITDVAFRVGFTDSNYFSRKFRSIMGTSPGKYRQQPAGSSDLN